jgi:hypothetical protein
MRAFAERAQRASTGELTNALEGLQSIAEAMESALAQVGYGELDEPDAMDASPGPFTDQQYTDALETVQSLLEAGEGLLEGVGIEDPDAPDDAPGRSTPEAPSAPSERDAGAEPHLTDERRDSTPADEPREPIYGTRRKESPPWML